jgi:ubiquinone/menaquinone biosynthesis C-methylase UbiE
MFYDLKGKRVLDVGCGTGRVLAKLRDSGASLFAADISEKMVAITKKKFPDVKTVVASIEKLPFEDESFDVVFAMFVIVHLKDLQKAFDEVYRVLKNGGIFILSNVNQRKPPKLRLESGEDILIKSHYHMPRHVIEALEGTFFKIEEEKFIYGDKVWINQVIKAVK